MEVESEPDLKAVFREVYTAYKNLQLRYDDVREEGKITTIYDNEKGVCIHVPDDKWYESVDEDNMATGELKEWFAAKGWHNVTFDDFEGTCDNPEEHLKSGMPSTHRWQKFIEPKVEPKVEKCWTCGCVPAPNAVFRDALNEYEYTCDECHRNEYPEEYEDEEDEPEVEPKVESELKIGSSEDCPLPAKEEA